MKHIQLQLDNSMLYGKGKCFKVKKEIKPQYLFSQRLTRITLEDYIKISELVFAGYSRNYILSQYAICYKTLAKFIKTLDTIKKIKSEKHYKIDRNKFEIAKTFYGRLSARNTHKFTGLSRMFTTKVFNAIKNDKIIYETNKWIYIK